MPQAIISPSILSSDFAQLAVESQRMINEGADWLHIEASQDPGKLIDEIREHGMKVGVAVKPKTPIDVIFPLGHMIDMCLVMTVEPGFGGQKFMTECMPKVKALRERFPELNIEVDGGLSLDTIDEASKAGANVIVAGTSIFKASNPNEVIKTFRNKVTAEQVKYSKLD
ncbi:23246_t:CDS:2 [Cetraspora pellucida]|uniref:Ribulose-phosphate 3-epimerase n=1 Tax=Cetraspora pellucida TaxID=1433469 RepID=A0A9N8VUF8_9GLOM|nr:23246_t:CDS:2 [Cetraspora pellucida]